MMKNKKYSTGLMIAASCLVIVFIILLIIIINTIGKSNVKSNDIVDLEYYLRRENYNEVYNTIRRNEKRKVRKNSDYKKYEAVADYYFNAFRYKVHLEFDDGKDYIYYEAMEDAKSRMKDFAFAADDIDELLD